MAAAAAADAFASAASASSGSGAAPGKLKPGAGYSMPAVRLDPLGGGLGGGDYPPGIKLPLSRRPCLQALTGPTSSRRNLRRAAAVRHPAQDQP